MHQARVIAALRQYLRDNVCLADMCLGDVLDHDPGPRRQLCCQVTDLIAQRHYERRVVEDPQRLFRRGSVTLWIAQNPVITLRHA